MSSRCVSRQNRDARSISACTSDGFSPRPDSWIGISTALYSKSASASSPSWGERSGKQSSDAATNTRELLLVECVHFTGSWPIVATAESRRGEWEVGRSTYGHKHSIQAAIKISPSPHLLLSHSFFP